MQILMNMICFLTGVVLAALTTEQLAISIGGWGPSLVTTHRQEDEGHLCLTEPAQVSRAGEYASFASYTF